MKPATWHRVRELFERLDEVPPEGRRAWLDRECSGEPEVRAQLEKLAAADEANSGWLSEHAEIGWLSTAPVAPLQPGERLGPYVVRSLLGSGGMGAVYCAEQEQPRRLVALKTLRGDLVSEDLLRRFRTEAEVLGQLRHPGIAQIHEAGTHDGEDSTVPYLAMEYVEGARDLVTYAVQERLGERERLELFLSVCEAVQHGHQKGVIHRDLKPGNVLVDGEGRPKVIDFGLARPLDPEALEVSVVQTRAGEILGTLAYMSPEHVSGQSFDVDVRSDVYSLGCILCELVTGAPPRDLSETPLPAAVLQISQSEVTLEGRVSGELRWILERALAREPERRYVSAAALADDVRRRLRSEPVVAGPPSAVYRLRRFARRHSALLLGTAAVLVALAVGLFQARVEARSARRAQRLAEQRSELANQVSVFLANLLERASAYRQGRDARLVDALEIGEQGLSEVEDPAVRAVLTGIVGKGFLDLESFDRAEPLLTEAVDVVRAELPPNDLFRLRTEVFYADLLEQSERLDASRALSEELLPTVVRELGEDDHLTLYLRYNLASTCGKQGDFRCVEEQHLARLAVIEASDGGPGRSVAYMDALHKIGVARGELGRYDEAEQTLAEALRLARELPGVSPSFVPTFQMDFAGLLSSRGAKERALEVYLEAEAAYGRIQATASNRYAIAINTGWSLLANGHLWEAAERLERARELVAANWSERGPRAREARRLEAHLALAEDEFGIAEEIARELLALTLEGEPSTSPRSAQVGDLLARALHNQGRAVEAAEVADVAHRRMCAVLGPEHRGSLQVLSTLVKCLGSAGRLEEARERALELVAATRAEDPKLEERRALLALVEDS